MKKEMTPKQKKLAAMSGDKGKITRGDVIKAAQTKNGKKTNNKDMKAMKGKKK